MNGEVKLKDIECVTYWFLEYGFPRKKLYSTEININSSQEVDRLIFVKFPVQ